MNYKAALVFTFLFLCLTNLVSAQKENNNWYFGKNAGITFNNGNPIALPASAMHTYEGTISVSDSAGNLLFYSDGNTIWNRNHLPMLNGTGLMGNKSATQSVLAVPLPGSKTIYYIFTVDAMENGLLNGLRFSIIDMTLDGGMGGITKSNILLEKPVTEKLIGIKHANNFDFWILAHKWNSNGFVAYKLSDAGISSNAVISYSGSMHGGSLEDAACQLKANKQGTKIALTKKNSGTFELFDFDAASGKVSNARSSAKIFVIPYGVEFSGDGTKLYGTANQPNCLVQFNLSDAAPMQSFISIPTGNHRFFGLQIGPDNKIYCSSLYSGYLSVINKPDSVGSYSKFERNGLFLNGNQSISGFPNMIVTERKINGPEVGLRTENCFGEVVILGGSPVPGTSYLWDNGSTNSTLEVTKAGKYSVIIKKGNSVQEVMYYVQFKDCNPIFPNIITPNDDKLNDAFILKKVNAGGFSLQLFNRWGNLIYKTESYLNDWDARNNPAGLYYYLLRNSETGTTYNGWLEVEK